MLIVLAITAIVVELNIPNAFAQSAHLISFGPFWHFAGNETLPGTLGDYICSIPPTPCPQHPIFTADMYVNNLGKKVDLVTRGEGHIDPSDNATTLDSYDIVIANSTVYCVATNSTSSFIGLNQYYRCPSVINQLSPL